jgi:hypothetical protein
MWLLAECHRDTKRRPQPYQPKDFMPASMLPEEKPISPEQVFKILKAAFIQNKAKESRK